LRTVLIGGGSHSAYFAINAVREIDPYGRLVVIEFTSEKVDVLSRMFPFAELIRLDIDEVDSYVRSNSSIIDVVITATESDALNLRYCKMSKENAIPIIISIINNPLNAKIFADEGITYVINPYDFIHRELAEILEADVNILYRFHKTDILLASIKISKDALLHYLRKEIGKSHDLSAIFVSKTGEVTNSIDKVGLGWKAYLIGTRLTVEQILKNVRWL